MNFTQWKTYVSKGEIPKVVYVCGEQPTLIEIVIDDIVTMLNVPVTDFININPDQPIWELASQYSLDPQVNRLVIVRNAEKVTDWSGLYDWLSNSRANPKSYLVFVSYAKDAPGLTKNGKKITYSEHIETIKTKGKFIRCSMPNDEDLISWAMSYNLSRSAAEYLITRTSGSTAEMFNVLKKVHVWDGSPSPKALALLCDELALDSFCDYLITRDKASALLSLNNMTADDKLKSLMWLDHRLTTVYEISSCIRKRMYDSDIAASTNINIYIVKRFKSVAKEYDDRKLRFCRQLIAMTDSALRDGAKTGVMEALISLW